MKIRTIYFKVTDMKKAATFWEDLLGIKPHKTFEGWYEFMIGDLRLGLLLNKADTTVSGSNCVPVFEFKDEEVMEYIEKAKKLGAKIIYAGLKDPNVLAEIFEDPFGNQFELSKFHE